VFSPLFRFDPVVTSANQRSSFFWGIWTRRSVAGYRRFETTNVQSPRTGWSLKTGPIFCPNQSITNFQQTLSNITEERRPHLYRSKSSASPTSTNCTQWNAIQKGGGTIIYFILLRWKGKTETIWNVIIKCASKNVRKRRCYLKAQIPAFC
jgi:hypothetical protein